MSDMDDGESSAPKNRKRTESNGGSSDSELSEGWNIVDQTDVTNHDIPSSDGESVEVIDAEDEARENGMTDTEVEGDSQLSPVADTPLVSSSESEPPVVPEGTHQEEMFDSSFCWFLFFATAAVLVSNLAFMVAENAFAWNMDVNIEAPSFLRDLPTTPKPMDRNEIVPNIPWAERDEVLVEVLNDRVTRRDAGSKYNKQSQSYEMNKKQTYKQSAERFDKNSNEKFNKQSYGKFNKKQNENNNQQSEKFNKGRNEKSYDINEKLQKDSLDFDDHEIGRFFTALSEVATSSETKNKLNQILLILDALYIGLNDIEEVVTENSELHDVLRKQKHKLSQVLTEMEYGVSKSLDRVTSNVLNKVQKLERRFENQWCELERRGHQEELKGLFYDCQENSQSEYQTNLKHSETIKDHTDATVKENSKIDMNWNSYQYQVDKDSPGKEQRNMHSNEAEEVDEYYRLVKSDMQHNIEFSKEHVNIKHESSFERKDPSEENYKSKYTDHKRKPSSDINENKKFTDHKEIQYDDKEKYDKRNQYDDKTTHYDNKVKHDDVERTHHEDKRKNNDSKERYFDGNGKHDDKGKPYSGNGKPRDSNGKVYDDKRKDYNDNEKHHDKVKHHEDKGKNYDGDEKDNNVKSKHYDDRRKHYDDKENHLDDKDNHFDDKWKHHNDNGKNYDVKGKKFDDKEKYAHEKGYDRKRKFSDSKRNHDDRRKFSEDKRKHANNFDTYKTYESTEHYQQNKDQTGSREGQTKSEKTFVPNSEPEVIGKYLKESCDRARNKFSKLSNMYEKLKSFIDSKLRVPKKMFDSLFAKYCQVNGESLKWDKRFNREHPKGDFSEKNNKNFVKDDLVITEGLNKNVKIVEMSEVSPEDEAADPVTDNIIIPNNKPKLWVFNYDEPSYDNKSNLTGDWFFKAGESRSKMRWSHHRGDWWFERASHRRNHPQSPHWFSGRRKNWYFRRAWARQNCRHSTQDGLCDFSEDEKVTVPNPEFNFR